MKKLYLTKLCTGTRVLELILKEVTLYLDENNIKKDIIFISNEFNEDTLRQLYPLNYIIDMSNSFRIIEESDISKFEFLKDINNTIVIIDRLKINGITHVKQVYELLSNISRDNIVYMRSQLRRDKDSVVDFMRENAIWLTIVDTIIESYIKDNDIKLNIIKFKR